MRLKGLEASIQDPALGAREEELWSRLIVVRGYAERLTQEVNRPAAGGEEQMDEETELKAKKVGSPQLLFVVLPEWLGGCPVDAWLLGANVASRSSRITRSSSCISRRRSSPSGRTLSSGRRTGVRRRDGREGIWGSLDMVFLAAGRTGRKYIMCESTVAGRAPPSRRRAVVTFDEMEFQASIVQGLFLADVCSLSIIQVPYFPAFLANGYPTLPQCHPAMTSLSGRHRPFEDPSQIRPFPPLDVNASSFEHGPQVITESLIAFPRHNKISKHFSFPHADDRFRTWTRRRR